MNLRERVIELSARITSLRSEISELEKKRADLATIEKELDSILIRPGHENGSTSGSITDRIIKLLEAEPDGDYAASDIHSIHPDLKLPSLRSALARMADENAIQRSGR